MSLLLMPMHCKKERRKEEEEFFLLNINCSDGSWKSWNAKVKPKLAILDNLKLVWRTFWARVYPSCPCQCRVEKTGKRKNRKKVVGH